MKNCPFAVVAVLVALLCGFAPEVGCGSGNATEGTGVVGGQGGSSVGGGGTAPTGGAAGSGTTVERGAGAAGTGASGGTGDASAGAAGVPASGGSGGAGGRDAEAQLDAEARLDAAAQVDAAAQLDAEAPLDARPLEAGQGTAKVDAAPPPAGRIGTSANLKVAFVGDTDDGANFATTLQLIKAEAADAAVFSGDLSYSANAAAWWAQVDANLGPNFPVFISEGNHDAPAWNAYQPKFNAHVVASGAEADPVKLDNRGYHYVYKGLSMVFIGEDGNTAYPGFIAGRFAGDQHLWKVCNWHKLQAKMQIGGKPDEMGWGVYEACKDAGALISTGHEHSYERTKTLISTINQTIDPACPDPKQLCLSPGRTFVTVSGMGGRTMRDQTLCLPTTAPYGCKGEWASIYSNSQSSKFGSQFIVFNYQGDPTKAHGYFKNVAGAVVDEFDVTAK